MKIEIRPLSSITPYARNPRRNAGAVATVKASLKEYGWQQPIVVDAEGVIIAGHTRYLAALELGWKDAPVTVACDLTQAQVKAYRLMDNKSHERAEWDTELLALEMEDLQGMEFDLELTGFDLSELAGLKLDSEPATEGDTEPQISRAEELRGKWNVATGQLWQLGEHRLLCGDSTKAEDVARVMRGEKADMCLTDPPYGVAYIGCTKDKLTIENDDVSEDNLALLCAACFDEVDKATRPGAYWMATVPAGPLHAVFLNDWKRRGVLRQVLVWNKDSMVLGHSEYHYKHEPILFGWKPGNRLKNLDRTKTSVWDFDRPKASLEHPTMKPVAMWEYAIGNHTNPGDLIYEPFSGSGTTIIAGENLGRKVRAIEISPAYVAVALQRWADHTGKKPILLP